MLRFWVVGFVGLLSGYCKNHCYKPLCEISLFIFIVQLLTHTGTAVHKGENIYKALRRGRTFSYGKYPYADIFVPC